MVRGRLLPSEFPEESRSALDKAHESPGTVPRRHLDVEAITSDLLELEQALCEQLLTSREKHDLQAILATAESLTRLKSVVDRLRPLLFIFLRNREES